VGCGNRSVEPAGFGDHIFLQQAHVLHVTVGDGGVTVVLVLVLVGLFQYCGPGPAVRTTEVLARAMRARIVFILGFLLVIVLRKCAGS
jgi:hypothetical protein